MKVESNFIVNPQGCKKNRRSNRIEQRTMTKQKDTESPTHRHTTREFCRNVPWAPRRPSQSKNLAHRIVRHLYTKPLVFNGPRIGRGMCGRRSAKNMPRHKSICKKREYGAAILPWSSEDETDLEGEMERREVRKRKLEKKQKRRKLHFDDIVIESDYETDFSLDAPRESERYNESFIAESNRFTDISFGSLALE